MTCASFGLAEKIVVAAHHFLISADQKYRDVVRLARERVKFQHLFHVLEVDELVDVAVRIAGYVNERRVIGRLFVQPVNRHDREELIDRPVVGHRAKDREVAQVLRRKNLLQVVELFFLQLGGLGELRRARADFPEQHFAFGAVFEADQPEVELRVQARLCDRARRDNTRDSSSR